MTNLLTILLPILIFCESGGNDHALGDYRNGVPQAVGCLSIWPCVVEDCNRILAGSQTRTDLRHDRRLTPKVIAGSGSQPFTLADRYSREKSIEMATIYLSHYVTEKRLGRKPTLKDCALCWNQGPDWFKKKPNGNYWQKVKKELEK